ncbi:amidohydrolase family protein [Clostridium tagluense]|uniref:dihydroorotase n=1 Tax=Clostridium tagluense TaxID=360422 RepID=UPI001CF5BF70|nr:amidohydrolase family protein [Clostridium tagluense]MCB2312431.1 amidohydrolase family protein [Clostridium tagluense]MCB2317106.1 amidohydrolase family protein [Clostridium tagluense]MCB2321970.1 amidohydrolase family protein [Clostridium tagluense]MCB2326979.1 amidohydrolase family protein [Clostridium tagluense]MCB2331697.1 amidohydrolase family protein [Clostridium tagluense]
MFDLGIVNGRIYIDGRWYEGNLYIKDNKISTISNEVLEAKEEYDAKGRDILPGFIDPHVHFQLTVGTRTSADDFYKGSRAAAFGGITTYIDFLDPVKNNISLKKAFNLRRTLAADSVIDYAFHATIADLDEKPISFINEVKALGIPTIKLFTTYSSSDRRTKDRTIDRLLSHTKETRTLLLAHSENDGLILEGGKIPVIQHERSRPAIAEISEVIKLAEMTKYRDGRMYIVHTNCGTTVERLKENYRSILNRDFILESCPHYFIFSSSKYLQRDGYLYTMTPPLRSDREVKKLNDQIDNIFTIGTDHCPFNSTEKNREFIDEMPMGIGGVEYSFSLMYAKFGEKVIDKFTKNPAIVHGLYPKKGTLLPGSDADIVIFDHNEQYIIKENHSNVDYNLYKDMEITGRVCSTISKGKFVVKDGVFIGGKGEYLSRELKY